MHMNQRKYNISNIYIKEKKINLIDEGNLEERNHVTFVAFVH